MFVIAAVICFAVAVIVHGAAFTPHIRWLDTEGLTLLGLFFLALGAVGAPPWRKRDLGGARNRSRRPPLP